MSIFSKYVLHNATIIFPIWEVYFFHCYILRYIELPTLIFFLQVDPCLVSYQMESCAHIINSLTLVTVVSGWFSPHQPKKIWAETYSSPRIIVAMPHCLNAPPLECPKPSRNAPNLVAMPQPRSRNAPLLVGMPQ